MARLVRLAGDRPSDDLWINPEHIVSVRKIVSAPGLSVSVHAEIKMVGQPHLQFLVAHEVALDEVEAHWSRFIAELETPEG